MSIQQQVQAVRARMAAAAESSGRRPEDIALCAATKVQSDDTIRAAIAAGITLCGENRVQELTAHLAAGAYEGARVHFIGHLQTNKVKQVVGKVELIHSVDSERLLRAITARRRSWASSRTSCWRSTSPARRAREAAPPRRRRSWPG